MNSAASVCYIKDSKLSRFLDKKFLKIIADKSRILKFSQKRGVSKEFPIDNKVYIVHAGIVFLSCIDTDGKKIILDILTTGSIFGDLDFSENSGSNECLYVEPLGEARVCEMKKTDFREILLKNPEFTLSLLSNMSNQLMSLEQKVGTLVYSNVEARIISLFLSLAEEYGETNDTSLKVDLKLTHEKLSEMIGSARETVTDAISELKQKGVIKQDKSGRYLLLKEKVREVYLGPSSKFGG
jgi:CRP/FNR family transcriptional regulator